jgi:hypothetical protein
MVSTTSDVDITQNSHLHLHASRFDDIILMICVTLQNATIVLLVAAAIVVSVVNFRLYYSLLSAPANWFDSPPLGRAHGEGEIAESRHDPMVAERVDELAQRVDSLESSMLLLHRLKNDVERNEKLLRAEIFAARTTISPPQTTAARTIVEETAAVARDCSSQTVLDRRKAFLTSIDAPVGAETADCFEPQRAYYDNVAGVQKAR